MMRVDAAVEKAYRYPKPMDFRKSIGLAALIELEVKLAVFDPLLFVFLNRARNRLAHRKPAAGASFSSLASDSFDLAVVRGSGGAAE